MKPVAWH